MFVVFQGFSQNTCPEIHVPGMQGIQPSAKMPRSLDSRAAVSAAHGIIYVHDSVIQPCVSTQYEPVKKTLFRLSQAHAIKLRRHQGQETNPTGDWSNEFPRPPGLTPVHSTGNLKIRITENIGRLRFTGT